MKLTKFKVAVASYIFGVGGAIFLLLAFVGKDNRTPHVVFSNLFIGFGSIASALDPHSLFERYTSFRELFITRRPKTLVASAKVFAVLSNVCGLISFLLWVEK